MTEDPRNSGNAETAKPKSMLGNLSVPGVTHRLAGRRDAESQAFIESSFGQFKKRCAWRTEWDTIEQATSEITAFIDHYHHRPHSGPGYRTPAEVAATWRNRTDLHPSDLSNNENGVHVIVDGYSTRGVPSCPGSGGDRQRSGWHRRSSRHGP